MNWLPDIKVTRKKTDAIIASVFLSLQLNKSSVL